VADYKQPKHGMTTSRSGNASIPRHGSHSAASDFESTPTARYTRRTRKPPKKRINKLAVGAICGVVAVAIIAIVCVTMFSHKENDKANVLVDNILIISGHLEPGATITVEGEQGEYWKTTIDGKSVFVAKECVITDSEKAAADAYASAAANRGSSSYSYSEPEPYYEEPQPQQDTPAPQDSSSGQDGGEIVLASCVQKLLKVFEPDVAYAAEEGEVATAFVQENATVLENGADIVVAILKRGDIVEIIEVLDDGTTKIKIGDIEGVIKSAYLRLEGETAPAEKDSFATVGAAIFSDVELANKVRDLTANEVIRVLDQIDQILVVSVDGGTYYMAIAEASDTEVEVPTYTNASRSYDDDDDDDYSGGSSGGDGGGGSTPQQSEPAAPTEEWTEEIM